jgi:shikimate kinase
MHRNNIILTGFMGSGKTTVGRKLSHKLCLRFIDIDVEVERYEGMSIKEIFEKKGESYFRVVESKVITKVSKMQNAIIATGGGSLLDPNSYQCLKNSGTIIWLKADLQTLLNRISDKADRPLLSDPDNIENLFYQRSLIYEKSDIIIDTTSLSIDVVDEEIYIRIGMQFRRSLDSDDF